MSNIQMVTEVVKLLQGNPNIPAEVSVLLLSQAKRLDELESMIRFGETLH